MYLVKPNEINDDYFEFGNYMTGGNRKKNAMLNT